MGIPQGEGWREMTHKGFPPGLGTLWARRAGDGWEYGLALDDGHANATGVVHGGVLLSLADHALSLAAWEASGRMPCVTVQLSAYFLHAVQPEGYLRMRGDVVRMTGGLAFVQGNVLDTSDQVVARAEGVWRVHRTRSPGAA